MIPFQEYFFHRKRCVPHPSFEFPAKRAKIVSPPDCHTELQLKSLKKILIA